MSQIRKLAADVPKYPARLEKSYELYLSSRANLLYEATLATLQKMVFTTELSLDYRRDSVSAFLVLSAIESLRRMFGFEFDPSPSNIRQRAKSIALWTKNEAERTYLKARRLAGYPKIENRSSVPAEDSQINSWVSENIRLIKTIDSRWFSDVEKVFQDAYQSGESASEIAKKLSERYGISENRARFIASDQSHKLYSKIVESTHKALGIESYVWDTERDSRVRPAHRIRQGKTIKYSEPPEDGHAGEAPGCRCKRRALING